MLDYHWNNTVSVYHFNALHFNLRELVCKLNKTFAPKNSEIMTLISEMF